MAKCLKCKNVVDEGVRFCPKCGSTLLEQETIAFKPGMPKTVQIVRLGSPQAAAVVANAQSIAPAAKERGVTPSHYFAPVGPGAGAANVGIGREIDREDTKARLERELKEEREARIKAEEELDDVKHAASMRELATMKIHERFALVQKISRYAIPSVCGLILMLVIFVLIGFSGKSKAVRELAEYRPYLDMYDSLARVTRKLTAERDALLLHITDGDDRTAPASEPKGGRQPPAPAPVEEQRITSVNINIPMVPVNGGAFKMGCTPEQGRDCDEDETPVRTVRLASFSIGKYPVTQTLWQRVMGTNPSKFKGPNRPVEHVNWHEAQEFVKRLNQMTGKSYRLPTEAEWEFAARGGANGRGYKYSGGNRIEEVAWYSSNSKSGTNNVGARQANELGIHDMSGNVAEWVSDLYGRYPDENETNPYGPLSGSERVLRGGSWTNGAKTCRVSKRIGMVPGARGNHIGFRLAHSD